MNFFSYLTKDRLDRIQAVLTISALLIAGVWSYFLFKYQYTVLPSLDPTTLSFKSQFNKIGSDDSLDYYKLTISVKNNSKVIEALPSSFYTITGYDLLRTDLNPFVEPNKNFGEVPSGFNRYFSADTTTEAKAIYFGKLLDESSILTPEDEISIENVIMFPKNKFQLMDVYIEANLCKKDVQVLTSWKTDSTGRIGSQLKVIDHHFYKKDDTISLETPELFEKYGITPISTFSQYAVDTNYCNHHNGCRIILHK